MLGRVVASCRFFGGKVNPIAEQPETILYIDLAGKNPDDGMTDIPYEKGAALLKLLERTLGRATFDAYLRSYFDRHAFRRAKL